MTVHKAEALESAVADFYFRLEELGVTFAAVLFDEKAQMANHTVFNYAGAFSVKSGAEILNLFLNTLMNPDHSDQGDSQGESVD